MGRKKTDEEFKKEVYGLVGDEYTVLGKYIKAISKLLIKHNKCNYEYMVRPNDFLSGYRCPKCAKNQKKDTEQFKAEIYNLTNNEYTLLSNYINAKTKVKLKHNTCGEIFFIDPTHFLRGQRCPNLKCKKERANKVLIAKNSVNFNNYLTISEKGEYFLLDDYIDQFTKVKILHKPCGNEYYITPKNFRRGVERCPICEKQKRLKEKDNDFKKYVSEHGKGNYEVVDSYKGNNIKLKFLHKECGKIYKATPSSFKSGNRCTHCSQKRKWDTEEFSQYVLEKEKGEYLLIGEYINARTKTEMKHNTCGWTYLVTPSDFKSGYRCPKCASSKGERAISKFLDKYKIIYEYNKSYGDACCFKVSLRFDFLIFDENGNIQLICEFDGIQHFEPVERFGGKEGFEETKIRDSIKNEFCKDKEIPLVRIPYWEIDNIHKILGKKLYKLGLLSTNTKEED